MKDLNKMFKPDSVAVIGASNTPGKVGYIIIDNIISGGYNGKVYPINPKGGEIQGLKAYENIKDVPEKVDLVIMSIPAAFVNESIKDCGEAGVENMVVISAGFKEIGEEGAKLEEELVALSKEYGINIIGPNSLGITDSHTPLNSSFAQMMPPKGNIAFISQSGAMMVALLDWSLTSGIGFSKVISLGNKAGVTETELMEYLAEDPETAVIICYLESISDDDNFVNAMRKTTAKKPIVVLKSGSSNAGAEAASSHTGALAGSDLAFDTAFEQSGILRVSSMAELFDIGLAFSKAPLPEGNNVAIITNAGGGGVLTVDEMERQGLELVQFDEETKEKIYNLISQKQEGAYWDFKREWYSKEKQADLLHDIICMANNMECRDAYIIIGIDEEKECSIQDVKNDSNRRNTQKMVDFLRDKKFAGGVRPRVVVEPLQVEDGEIDIIIIKNDYYTPYFLEENYKGVNRISPQGV